MRICPLSSGSKGNCTFIESENTRILIDAGLSGKKLEERLADIDVSIESIDAVLITHEHSDHVGGAGVLGRKYGLITYIHPHTHAASTKIFKGTETIKHISGTFTLKDMTIDCVDLSHDAAHPYAFKIESDGKRCGVVTDLGVATQLVRFKMRDCHALVLEMNHDVGMLQRSTKYPWDVKQRILSNYGHLSNEAGAELFNELVTENTKQVFLAHLSEENNDPYLAKDVLYQRNEGHPLMSEINIEIAHQHRISQIYEF